LRFTTQLPVDRIATQISTSTPDKPVLSLEIRTHDCGSLEKAIHATLEYRGKKISGALCPLTPDRRQVCWMEMDQLSMTEHRRFPPPWDI
jgi:hypothetical protein